MSDSRNLKFAIGEQRRELQYHRKRRRQIFIWCSSILLAIFGAALAANPDQVSFSIKEGLPERILVSILVITFIVFSVSWQHYQRQREARHQQIISSAYRKMGLAGDGATVYPEHYGSWGEKHVSLWSLLVKPNRVFATVVIGLCTLAAVWIDLAF
jgi:hypothetical protein